jgi:predicted TIM-barrel fold metal-dependent hydrolase
MESNRTRSAEIRARLSHPIIDSDGHIAEFEPALIDYLEREAGSATADRVRRLVLEPAWYRATPQERLANRIPRPTWWAHPARNTLDRATSSLPRLLHRRLDDFGLDVAIIYPSIGLFPIHYDEPEVRLAMCRAFNRMQADIFREYRDRLIPVAIIPMHTPAEAIAELEYAVNTLGFKAIVMPAYVRRPIEAVAQKIPELVRYATWFDNFCIDCSYDYDPVWAKCLELKLSPTFHSPTSGLNMRATVSSFVYNHIGHFAAGGEGICKALFLGGVTRRFPQLRFAFMEGGVSWGCALFSDLISHWSKRNVAALAHLDPANRDENQIRQLFEEYGGEYGARIVARQGQDRSHLMWGSPEDSADIDEFARCAIAGKVDIRELFIPKFFFGCEGDDRMSALAFDARKNPMGVRLNAIYSSDIGHFDIPDMRDAAEEAYEMVEDGLIDTDDFRDFVFANPVRAKTDVNPEFFKDTVVEDAVVSLLKVDRVNRED